MASMGFAIVASALLVWTMPEGCGLGDAHSGALTIVGLQGMAYSIASVGYFVWWCVRERKLIAQTVRDLFS